MKKIILGIMVSVLLVATVMAVKPAGPSNENGLNGKGKASQLYLFQKCVEGRVPYCSWDAEVDDGSLWGPAWGKMTFDTESFVFNGHGLEPDTGYTLLGDAEWGWRFIV